MNQHIRECFGIVMEEKLDGEVELDEAFVGGKITIGTITRK